MDLHRSRSVLLRMTPRGTRLGRVRIDNSPTGPKAEIAEAGPHPRTVLEATYGWHWAADALTTPGSRSPYLDTYLRPCTVDLPAGPAAFTVPGARC